MIRLKLIRMERHKVKVIKRSKTIINLKFLKYLISTTNKIRSHSILMPNPLLLQINTQLILQLINLNKTLLLIKLLQTFLPIKSLPVPSINLNKRTPLIHLCLFLERTSINLKLHPNIPTKRIKNSSLHSKSKLFPLPKIF